MEARAALESMAASLANRNWTDADTEFVAKNIDAQEKARSLNELSRLDIDLHHYIVTCSGNLRLLQLWEPLRWQWEAHLVEIYRRQNNDDFIPEKETIKAHKHLLEALANGTPSEASQSMMNHILFNLRWAK
jgi:DNA-binding GntR family transcriptional regulator